MAKQMLQLQVDNESDALFATARIWELLDGGYEAPGMEGGTR